jgi:hypothetical protein
VSLNIWNNDDVLQFGRENNLGNQYNDILLRYLRDYFGLTLSLPDLLAKYRREVGDIIDPSPSEGSYYVESYYVEDYYVG